VAAWFDDRIREQLIYLPRAAKSTLAIVADIFGLTLSAGLSLWLTGANGAPISSFALTTLVFVTVSVLAMWSIGLYKSVIRYVGLDLLEVGVKVASVAAIIGFLSALPLLPAPVAMRWAFSCFAFSLIYLCGIRYMTRVFLRGQRGKRSRENILIYGAGTAAAQLIPSLIANESYLPVAVVDDDAALHETKVQGVAVFSPKKLPVLIRKFNVSRILLAMPSVSRRQRRKVLEHLSEYPVHVQTIPDIDDIVSGKAQVDEIRDVDVKDLLGRDSVPPNEHLLQKSITGKSVMVTGAGGSIGSELCRQILALKPHCLVILELSEPSLYAIDRELKKLKAALNLKVDVVSLLGSVHHEDRIREALSAFKVNTVFHAAAYKHVPIVEHNLFEGIHNNVLGTLHAARAARDAGVKSFILISTDKAVNPTNVMGATKRMAELILQAMNEDSTTTFSMVRFGNVLASSGSVVPLFKEQIRSGGPVTVTHRDIIRYFMTIPEAAQLVIQAGSMAEGGDVFVLDMGKPVKIHDLAVRMINLMGMTVKDEGNPEGDIEIQFVGLRPAEKLYEELLIGSNVRGTDHPRILRAGEDYIPRSELGLLIDELQAASRELDCERAKVLLMSAVKEYAPGEFIEDHVWRRKQVVAAVSHDTEDRIIEFPGPG